MRENNNPQIGQIIRYSDGISALGRIVDHHAGGWHIDHVLGGVQFTSKAYMAGPEDIIFCNERRPDWFVLPIDTIYELHEKLTKHLFPAYSSEDERFLALALCGEAGELANMVKKRWRDGVDLTEEIKDEIADIRVYLELIAKKFGIEGEKLDARVKSKLEKVVEKHRARLG